MNLETIQDRMAFSNKIKQAIEDHCKTHYDSGHRSHLGASLIGEECLRKSWYSFRWVKHEKHSGRMQRLFNRGHLEEYRFCEWLRAIGIKVSEYQDGETKTQYRIVDAQGHFGGSLDGLADLKAAFDIDSRLLLEFKTHNTKSFCKLAQDSSVKLNKPQHYAQMCTYGVKKDLHYGLYCAINKNDDDIYIEVVELDHNLGKEMLEKGKYIITSQTPPNRISKKPAYFKCNFCHFQQICHYDAATEKNCRSCTYSQPVEDKQWRCNKFNGVIPKDFIPKGCDSWEALPND